MTACDLFYTIVLFIDWFSRLRYSSNMRYKCLVFSFNRYISFWIQIRLVSDMVSFLDRQMDQEI